MLIVTLRIVYFLKLLVYYLSKQETATETTSLDETEPDIEETPEPQDDPDCDPNYSGCVPIASDVDCSGGSGNGPAYAVGPVTVIGRDIYGLDRNGDGVGCE
jgi:hypothetical protein